MYPASYNVYDSTGEALMNNGDYLKAIACYEKLLNLNHDNRKEKMR